MEKEDNDIFFVEIRESNEVRRTLLESLRGIVESLQRFEKFKGIRKTKTNYFNTLRKNMKEFNKQISSLRSILPESRLKVVETKPVQSQKEKAVKKKKQVVEKKAPSELQKLESELSAIEEKLKGLQ